MHLAWISFLVVLTSIPSSNGVSVEVESNIDGTNDVLHRLDELERRDRAKQTELEILLEENKELKRLRKIDTDILQGLNTEIKRLIDNHDKTGKEIDYLSDQNKKLGERIRFLEELERNVPVSYVKQRMEESDVFQVDTWATKDDGKTLLDVTQNSYNESRRDALPVGEKEKRGPQLRRDIYNENLIRQTGQISTIAFFATLNNPAVHLGALQPIVFDNVVTNVGQGYDSSTGVFKAPVSGIYVFSTTLLAVHETANFQFAVNGKAYSVMIASETDIYETMSQTTTFNLVQGDDVAILNYDPDKSLIGLNYSTFSGFLLM